MSTFPDVNSDVNRLVNSGVTLETLTKIFGSPNSGVTSANEQNQDKDTLPKNQQDVEKGAETIIHVQEATSSMPPVASENNIETFDQTDRDEEAADDNWWPIDSPFSADGGDKLRDRFGGGDNNDSKPLLPSDVNEYQRAKNLAHGVIDLALLSANLSQLRNMMESSSHSYYYVNLALISISIILQVAIGILLILNSRCDVIPKETIHKAVDNNNKIIAGVFLITIINLFISAFGVTPSSIPSIDSVVQNTG